MLSAFVLGQNLLQPSACPMQAHLGGAFGDPQGARHGGLRQIVDVPQRQQLTVLRGQTANGSAHIHLQWQQIKPIGSDSVAQIEVIVEARSGCRLVAMPKSFVANDRAQPRARLVGHRAVPQAPPHADHRLLGDVSGVVGPGHAAGFAEAPRREFGPVEIWNVEKL
ncbi:MAG TPA: hypothetical protein VFG42_04555 [Baekduia sp.]|nr:hypothetical protein [Baekduia sp.]HET6506035.1 hypothetical protein [Baekduia sp.]